MPNFKFRLRNEPGYEPKHTAFDYQREAATFVSTRDFAAIFHEQGLGKTKIAIDVMLTWLSRGEVDTVIVFTKKGLITNWVRELRTHSQLTPLILSSNSKKNYYAFTTPTRLVLCHFEAIVKEFKRFKIWLESRRVAVIMDESAKIKNPYAHITRAFFDLRKLFRKRVIMTGTPVANRPYDLWAQLFFLDGGATLGMNFEKFKGETDLTKRLKDDETAFVAYKQRLVNIQNKIAEISVRETKGGGRISLPAKEYERIECEWEPAQHALYRQVQEELRALIVRDGRLISEDQESILKRLLRLIQIASNPSLIDDSYQLAPGKFETLYNLISDIANRDEKIIVWTSFNGNCSWLAKRLDHFGAKIINGRMDMLARTSSVDSFINDTQTKVLIATPGAAKEGLTLTVANHAVFYDRTYSLDDYLQAQDRIHRVSQIRTCYVYNLLMPDSIDGWVDALLEQKRLAAQLTQGDIDVSVYSENADLSFFEIVAEILSSGLKS